MKAMSMMGPMRIYGGSIALASGFYAIYLAAATGMAGMDAPMWLMLALGIAVIAHGIVLLTPLARHVASVSGPLMLLWAVLMLANEAWMAAMPMMAWDAGMVMLALLMLVSGLVMTVWPRMAPAGGMQARAMP